MSIFDQNSPEENNEEILYETIEKELQPILQDFHDIKLDDVLWLGSSNKIIKDTSKLVMQFIWMKLGMKIPNYTRRILNDKYNII